MITRLGQLGKRLDEIMDHSNMIVHTGSFQGEKKSVDNPERVLWNIQNTFKYLEQARIENKLFVYISTWDRARNPYVTSKIACEGLVQQWGKTYNMKCLILRIPSIIGRGICHTFLDATEELIIEDRELEFLTLDEVSKIIRDAINTFINQESVYYIKKIEGKKISVQLLYDLLRYTKGYLEQ